MKEYRKEVHKVIQWKGGCVYRTKKVCDVWLPIKSRTTAEENQIAKEHGGDQLVNTKDYR